MDNSSNLVTLARVSQTLRQLISRLVSQGFNKDQLDLLQNNLQRCLEQLPEQRQERPIAHFNNHLATSQTNLALPYSPICGPFNPAAPPLDLSFDTNTGVLQGKLLCNRVYEGPKDMVHGGVIAACYDQILAMLTTCLNKPSFTAYLHVNYLLPTPLEQDLEFSAHLDRIEGKKLFVKGQCFAAGKLISSAEGLFIYSDIQKVSKEMPC